MRHLEDSESGQEMERNQEVESGQEEMESGQGEVESGQGEVESGDDETGSGVEESTFPPSSPTVPSSPPIPPAPGPERFFFEVQIIVLNRSSFDKDAFRRAIAEEWQISEDLVHIVEEDHRRNLQEGTTIRVQILTQSREEAVNLLSNIRSLEPFSSAFTNAWGIRDYVFPSVTSITSTFCESGSTCLPPSLPPALPSLLLSFDPLNLDPPSWLSPRR